MKAYRELLDDIIKYGDQRPDRTGVGTRSLFGAELAFDLQEGFPAVTGKKLMFDSVKAELVWMLSGSTNVEDLACSIWDEWADEDGELGPVYGHQWRSWGWDAEVDGKRVESPKYDQIQSVIDSIQTNPYSRRHIVSAWNAGQIDQMALPPCHMLFQFYVRPFQTPEEVMTHNGIQEKLEAAFGPDIGTWSSDHPDRLVEEAKKSGLTWGYLDCKMTQRSADAFLGLPFNIASYATLTHMVGQVCGLAPGRLTISLGDAHIYANHTTQVNQYLCADTYPPPTLQLNTEVDTIDDFQTDDIALEDYEHGPFIQAPIAT